MPTFTDICEAANRLKGVAHITPVLTSRQLNARAGAQVFLKCENFQRVGAFKFRGAYYAVSRLPTDPPLCPVVALSSGNHAQGVALACALLGREAHLVMPEPINPVKRAAVEGYGGHVHPAQDPHRAEDLAQELTQASHGHFIHAFNDPDVIAGQGTATLELLQGVDNLDALLAPVGGGGLLSGAALAGHAINPRLALYACEPAGALDAFYSVQENRVVPQNNPHTLAEGLKTSLGSLTLAILRAHLSGFFVVDESEIVEAMRFTYERLKIVIEPASAVALVPLLRRESLLEGKKVGVILTGGNVDWAVVGPLLAKPPRVC
ncbi:MAG: threonine/serine dehydratase [Nitrospirae bacterium]|nr:MAG: threonine/serine dehydratase [Nitrospirota bacterium]